MKTKSETRVSTRRILWVVVLLGFSCGAWAGVGARGDGKGRYEGTSWQIHSVKPFGHIWSEFNTAGNTFTGLNPGGDANGDLWPTVAEDSSEPHHPWVVWSRFNGADYDLAWARWRGARWSAIRKVHREEARGDDMDADIAFGGRGRPYLVWWRNDKGVGRVFMSVFLNSRWMGEIQVSEHGVDSRYPTIEVSDDGRLMVEYRTPRGLFAQVVQFHEPATITDDINPFSHVEMIGRAVMVNPR